MQRRARGTAKFAYNAMGLVAKMRWKDTSSMCFFYDGMLQRYATIASGASPPPPEGFSSSSRGVL